MGYGLWLTGGCHPTQCTSVPSAVSLKHTTQTHSRLSVSRVTRLFHTEGCAGPSWAWLALGRARCPQDTNSTFLRQQTYAPRCEHVYGRARGTSLCSDAALRALGDDRELTEEQLAPLARVHGDAADRAVIDGRRGHGRSLEKVPGKLGRVERGAPEVIVPGNRQRWELLTGVKWVVAGSWHLVDR